MFWALDFFLVKNPLNLKNLFTFIECGIEEKGAKRKSLSMNCPINWFTDGVIVWVEKSNLVYYIEQDCGYRILKLKKLTTIIANKYVIKAFFKLTIKQVFYRIKVKSHKLL